MAQNKNQHVVPTGEDWGVKGEGNSRFTTIVDTQSEAYEIARDIARNQETEVFIHGRNGRIRARESFGSDPFPPKDKEH